MAGEFGGQDRIVGYSLIQRVPHHQSTSSPSSLYGLHSTLMTMNVSLLRIIKEEHAMLVARIRPVICAIVVVSAMMLGCATRVEFKSTSLAVQQMKNWLKEQPSDELEYMRDYKLYSRALEMSIWELAELDHDIMEAIDRGGVRPIVSFLIHYIERLYFAQPEGWRDKADMFREKIQPFLPLTKGIDANRTIGVAVYEDPIRTQVFSLGMANTFFCKEETALGQNMLVSGGGAHEVMMLAAITGQYSMNITEFPSLSAERLTAMKNLFDTYKDECAADGEDGSSPQSGHQSPADVFMACVKDSQGASEAAWQREIDRRIRCMEEQMFSPTDPLMKSPGWVRRRLKNKNISIDAGGRTYDKSDIEKAINDPSPEGQDVYDALEGELLAEDEYDAKEAAGTATEQNAKDYAKAMTDLANAVECYFTGKHCDGPLVSSSDDTDTDDPPSSEETTPAASPDGPGGPISEECLDPGTRRQRKLLDDFWGGLGGHDPTLVNPEPDSRLFTVDVFGGCGPGIFAAPGTMAACEGIMDEACTEIQFPLPDPCECFLTPDEIEEKRRKRKAEIGQLFSSQTNCFTAQCREGFICENGACTPTIVSGSPIPTKQPGGDPPLGVQPVIPRIPEGTIDTLNVSPPDGLQ